ncbi:threonine/serine exporter family protein [Anaerosporobacter sp.]
MKEDVFEPENTDMKESMERKHVSKEDRQARYKLLMDTALLAGQIMLKSGAETYRVEDTICRILHTSGLETAETFATVTGLFVTLDDPSIDAITKVTRVSEKQSNLSQVYEVNDVSRRLCSGKITVEQAYQQLLRIKNKKEYSTILVYIGIIMTSSFFTLLLGGGILASALSAINGLWIVACRHITGKVKLNTFITDMLSSFIIAVCTMLYAHLLNNSVIVEIIIVGSIMPLVPGVAITNAIRDTLQGDYLSGGSRAIEAFVIAACIAVGIGVGLAFGVTVIGGSML